MVNAIRRNYKDQIIAMFLVLSVLILFSSRVALAGSNESDFSINGSGMITAYNGAGGEVVIPEKIGNITVTGIGNLAFYGKTAITSITIPSMTSIGTQAFQGCSNLESVTITDVDSIVDHAFYGCQNLRTVTIEHVGSIGQQAFQSCTSLENVSIQDAGAIEANAFYGCSGLKKITILGSSTTIGNEAFQDDSNLASVTLQTVKSIANYAFYGCKNLKDITIQKSVAEIGIQAFQNCTSLISVALPGITNIGNNAFYGCSSLSAAYFYNNAPTMGNQVFDSTASNFFVYYLRETSGFTEPTWYGYKTAVFDDATQAAPTGLHGVAPTSSANSDGRITGVTTEMEYRSANAVSYTVVTDAVIMGLAADTYYVRYAAKLGYQAGADATVIVPAYTAPNQDQVAPTGLAGVAPTSAANNDGQITGVTTAMEYRSISAASYIAVTGTLITELSAGTYAVRYAAKTGYNASADTEVIVQAYTPVQNPQTYTLTIASEHGTVSKSPDKTAYDLNDMVTLTAIPESGYTFTGWSGDATGTEATINLTMDTNKSVTANYTQQGVSVPVASVVLNKTETALTTGKTEQLTATVYPNNATNKNLTWSITTGGDIVSVTNGLLTALSSGNATVRATSEADTTKYAECSVTVTAPVAVTPELSKEANNLADACDGKDTTSANIFKSDGYIIYKLSDLGFDPGDIIQFMLNASDGSSQSVMVEYLDSSYNTIGNTTLDVSGYKRCYKSEIPAGTVYLKFDGISADEIALYIYEIEKATSLDPELSVESNNLTHAYDGNINTSANIFKKDGYIIYKLSDLGLTDGIVAEYILNAADGSQSSVELEYLDAGFTKISGSTLDISGYKDDYTTKIAANAVYLKIKGIPDVALYIYEIGKYTSTNEQQLSKEANNLSHAYDGSYSTSANIFKSRGYIIYNLSEIGITGSKIKYTLNASDGSSQRVNVEYLDDNFTALGTDALNISGYKRSYKTEIPQDAVYLKFDGISADGTALYIYEIENATSLDPELSVEANNLTHAYDGIDITSANIFTDDGYIIYNLSDLNLAAGESSQYMLNAADGSAQSVNLEYLGADFSVVGSSTLDISGYKNIYPTDVPTGAVYVKINGLDGIPLYIYEIAKTID